MKNETKQTAVDWLIKIVIKSIKNLSEDECEYLSNLFQQAEEMEKQQIIDAYQNGGINGQIFALTRRINIENGEQYYNETFGGK